MLILKESPQNLENWEKLYEGYGVGVILDYRKQLIHIRAFSLLFSDVKL